ncbi:MAG TPA: lysophospholipase [Casimicrobiaceae bacterium]|nr:lysophospholipase [Casimicrobiaceae bacterium]
MRTTTRAAAALLSFLLLSGCAGIGFSDLAPRIAEPVPTVPSFASRYFVADDGAHLPLRVWLPAGRVKATILALHGFNDYSNAFDGPAADWTRDGIAVFAYDQRGFGRAPGRGLWPGTWRLDEDMANASRLVAARYPRVPHYILGESMGGAVAITGAARSVGAQRPVADGLILAAPAIWGRATMNLFERAALWTAYHFVPNMTLTGRGLHILASDNIPMLRALGRDPLVIKATRVDAIEGLVNLMDRALAAAPRLDRRLLVLYGEHDELIPREPVQLFIAALPRTTAAGRTVAWYPAGYHLLLRDLDAELVQTDIASWVLHPEAALPSGDDGPTGRPLAGKDHGAAAG